MELPMLVRSELIMVNWMLGVNNLTGISPAAMPTSTPLTKALTYIGKNMEVRKEREGLRDGR